MGEQLAVITAIIGAAGSAGAVFASFAFYNWDWDDAREPFKKHAEFVLFSALLTPLYHWPEYGSMFSAPTIAKSSAIRESKSVQDSRAIMGSMALLESALRPQLTPPVQRPSTSSDLNSDFDFLDMVHSQNKSFSVSAMADAKQKKEDMPVDAEIGASR